MPNLANLTPLAWVGVLLFALGASLSVVGSLVAGGPLRVALDGYIRGLERQTRALFLPISPPLSDQFYGTLENFTPAIERVGLAGGAAIRKATGAGGKAFPLCGRRREDERWVTGRLSRGRPPQAQAAFSDYG